MCKKYEVGNVQMFDHPQKRSIHTKIIFRKDPIILNLFQVFSINYTEKMLWRQCIFRKKKEEMIVKYYFTTSRKQGCH